jgi:hypothetical protein
VTVAIISPTGMTVAIISPTGVTVAIISPTGMTVAIISRPLRGHTLFIYDYTFPSPEGLNVMILPMI